MRKILILMIVIGVIFTGCGFDGDVSGKLKSPDYGENDVKPLSNGEGGNTEGALEDELYDAFLELINNGQKPSEIIKFIDREIKNVTDTTADNMVLALEEVQNIYEGYYQQKIFDSEFIEKIGWDFTNNQEIVDKAKGTGLEELVREIANGGYKFISREGTVYPVVDYSFLKKYSDFVSDKVAGYISIKSQQSDNPVAIDGALAVSWADLEERLLELEDYMEKHSDFPLIEQLDSIYYNYMVLYLAGADNTPAYSYDTKKYKDEVLKKIIEMTKAHEDTKTADIANDFLDIIKKDNYTFTNNAEKFINNLREKSFNNKMKNIYTKDIFTKLLPEKPGYRWLYHGFAEYSHEMKLNDIVTDKGVVKYFITGDVGDPSDGESRLSPEHFNIDIVYSIEDGALIQRKNEKRMMDSEFDNLELIRAPLTKGNKWGQGVIDKLGEYRYINCEITDINEVAGAKVYTVEYREDSGYYEIRMIEEGVGVVSFTKLWQSGEGDFEIGYSLGKEFSGYKEGL